LRCAVVSGNVCSQVCKASGRGRDECSRTGDLHHNLHYT
jgi:hypothetical protein